MFVIAIAMQIKPVSYRACESIVAVQEYKPMCFQVGCVRLSSSLVSNACVSNRSLFINNQSSIINHR